MTTNSDEEMDVGGKFNEPVNLLPMRCNYCTFPDIDSVSSPYLICKGITSPVDAYPAQLGNFLVRAHVKRVLEAVVPQQCRFVPTANWKTGESLDWWLAVPITVVETAHIDPKVPRCPKCAEPRAVHLGSHWIPVDTLCVEEDVFKSKQWCSAAGVLEDSQPGYWTNVRGMSEPPKFPKHQWTRRRLDRELWFSLRLEQLIKSLGFRGLKRNTDCKSKPTSADLDWMEAAAKRLSSKPKKVATKRDKTLPDSTKWFGAFLKKNKTVGRTPSIDVESKKSCDAKLPKAYTKYISTVGTRKTFRDVDGAEGYDVRIVGPKGLDAKTYRIGKIECDDDEPIDGLMFAVTGHGDCFCFDLKQNSPDYPVYRFNHERMVFEPYAQSFVEAVRRFASDEEL
ncbi:MAG: SMI1/KNR4 family protein [Pirellulaceae bacterium]